MNLTQAMTKSFEILAPVGNSEMLEAAVRSDADAVYLGAKQFSARRNAENFDNDELKRAVEYCHIRGVKVYLTLNIIIKDDELTEAFCLAKTAYLCGIDGIIVQDLGLCALLKKYLPKLPLHASTQMSVHSASALPVLKRLGFKRVVVSREMSLDDLKVFCKKAEELEIEVEAFVHGALCMCVSGQCLLSAFLGSRSGNRGLCAGPCRLPFKVENGTGFDLSLKDLSIIEYIPLLAELGVKSFKIEGRMKRPEYVAAAVNACRITADTGVLPKEKTKTLKNVFSRSGFTNGYLENKLGKDMFGIRTKDDVVSTLSAFGELHNLYRAERQIIPVDISAEIKAGSPIKVIFSDGENKVVIEGEIPQTANKKPAEKEDVVSSLSKLGGTPFFAKSVDVILGSGLFLPSAILNDLRRKAVEKLSEKRCVINRKVSENLPKITKAKQGEKKPKIAVRLEDIGQLPDDLKTVTAIYFPLEKEGFDILPKSKVLVADIPRGISSESYIENRLKLFKENGFTHACCGNLAAVQIAESLGFKLVFGTGTNIYNSLSAETAKALGATAVTLSSEITLKDAVSLSSPIAKGIVAYGNIPLMLFKNCPIKNGKGCGECDKKGVITDRLGVNFRIRCRAGFSEMLNSLPIWLADKKHDLNGLDYILLYFTDESKERVLYVIDAYSKGLPPDIQHTRGLFYRGSL